MFNHDEQKEIMNEFLTACGEKQKEQGEPEEQKDFKTVCERLLKNRRPSTRNT